MDYLINFVYNNDDHVEYTSNTSKRKTIENNYDEELLENATFLFNELMRNH
jgi:hypothetical protein